MQRAPADMAIYPSLGPMQPADDDFISLAEAASRFKREAGYCNAYSTLRTHAAASGRVSLGKDMSACKVRGRWAVRCADLESGIATMRRRRQEQAEAAEDYKLHILRGADDDQVATEWGYYRRRGPFHFVHYNAVPRGRATAHGSARRAGQLRQPSATSLSVTRARIGTAVVVTVR